VFVLVPGGECERDAGGEVVFKPEAVRRLDRVRAMAQTVRDKPTPGMIRALRDAMGLSQAELGERLGVTNVTVYRWEAGAVVPNAAAMKGLEKLRCAAGRRGVVIEAA
jgi:DNA-binding transcriptional regulator YiaG